MNNNKTLLSLFADSLFRIPDYQRGYAWEEKQWNDFLQDVDALVDEADTVKSHYTGTVLVYCGPHAEVQGYGTKRLKVVDVVDGQQRLTTCCLYLAEIIRALSAGGNDAFESDIPHYLYAGPTCKLTLNDGAAGVFHDLLRQGHPNTQPTSPHEKRLVAAGALFRQRLAAQVTTRGEEGARYLEELHHAVTQKLHFTFYTIEEECEIGMTFELMNSRGKGLSVLELLKNYLMHWVARNGGDESERTALTQLVNKHWKTTYSNLGLCAGDEDQCLRVAWTILHSHVPGNWQGYSGFKEEDCIPLRNFDKRPKEEVKEFLGSFADGLAQVSSHYATITSPTATNTRSPEEHLWLSKIHHSGNIANFLPLMVAARIRLLGGTLPDSHYLALLQALERYAYRVFLHSGRRSNAGKSAFYRWAHEVFSGKALPEVTAAVHALARHYAPEDAFFAANAKPSGWYGRLVLKYTLFEYELHLLTTEGKRQPMALSWGDLKDSTIEHILPQTPADDSRWKAAWSPDEASRYLHDIGNLVLTRNNSDYLNFEFDRKKGKPGVGPGYSNSDIRQEREVSQYSDWTPKELEHRRAKLIGWINDRWKTETSTLASEPDVVNEAEEDDAQSPNPADVALPAL